MLEQRFEILSSLCYCNSAAGQENQVQNYFKKVITTFVDDITTDPLGNVIAHKKGKGKKLMLIAHADEVSMMVTNISPQGYIYCKPCGGVDATIISARRVHIIHGEQVVLGVVGKKPIHKISPEEETVSKKFDGKWIDIGAIDKNDALKYVSIGDYVYYDSPLSKLNNDLITGKALDDRCGTLVLLSIAEYIQKKSLNYDVYFVSSVQEELGFRGAIVVANLVKPDACIVIDVTHATDYPSIFPYNEGELKLRSGCVLTKGPNIDANIFDKLRSCADKNKIEYQIEAIPCPTGTDANFVQISNTGVRTALVSIPCRYMHTPYEIVSLQDVQSTIELMCNFLGTNSCI